MNRKRQRLQWAVKFAFTAIGLAVAAPTVAQAPWPAPRPLVWPNSGAVARYYEPRPSTRIWFKEGTRSAAATQLLAILQRSPLDGFARGPQLAAEAQRALRAAQSGDPVAAIQAEQFLSTAWVNYVQALRAPVPGIVYGTEEVLQPRSVERILHEAATAASLAQHLAEVSNVNPIYAGLREAAWKQVQFTGGIPEPRLAANLARARVFPGRGRYIIVESATQRLFMMEDGRVRDSMRVIVGKPEAQTPLIASMVHYATFNPYWNAPDDLVRKNVAPGVLREGFKYLDDRGYDVMASWTENAPVMQPHYVNWRAVAEGRERVRLRKRPGGANPMGAVKIPFPNDLDIYLHDTFERDLFNKDQRALSLGCVRLEDAPRLLRWLFKRPVHARSEEAEMHVQLPQSVPIFLTYLTARPTASGVVFADDIYGRDRVEMARLGQ